MHPRLVLPYTPPDLQPVSNRQNLCAISVEPPPSQVLEAWQHHQQWTFPSTTSTTPHLHCLPAHSCTAAPSPQAITATTPHLHHLPAHSCTAALSPQAITATTPRLHHLPAHSCTAALSPQAITATVPHLHHFPTHSCTATMTAIPPCLHLLPIPSCATATLTMPKQEVGYTTLEVKLHFNIIFQISANHAECKMSLSCKKIMCTYFVKA